VEFAVTLEYPNGRRHDTVLHRDRAPTPGTEFEMHGHSWRVVGLIDTEHPDRLRRRVDPKADSTRILCVCVVD
jgi:hypothetical protein